MLDSTAPTAQLAERLYAYWKEHWPAGLPVMALIPETRHAAFLEALRKRMEKADPIESLSAGELRSAIRVLTDRGACLVFGGQDSRPALLNHLSLSPILNQALGAPLPILILGTVEENPLFTENGSPDFAPIAFGVQGPETNP